MSAIITGVLKLTIGVLWDKARDTAASRYEHGDLTDQQCRQLLVRELDDIKTKLDGLARKDLLSSICFLQEGVGLLYMSLGQSSDNQKGPATSKASQDEAVINSVSSLALSQAIASLKIVSQERFSSAKTSFKAAREKATEAFSNEALSLRDRILAAKLRVMSRLLENLEDPDAAASSCKLYLEALHKMPAVQQMFSVHVNGGMKAYFNKTKRLQNVKSVTMINVVLFDFIRKFTTFPQDLISWPRIETVKRPCYLILVGMEMLNELRESGVDATVPYEITLNYIDDDYLPWCSAVNSKGEIITRSRKNRGVLNVIDTTGEIKAVCSLPEEDTRARGFKIRSLAIDADDSVYVVTSLEEAEDVNKYKLFVYDDKFEIKKQVSLDFLRQGKPVITLASIAVNKDKKIFILEPCCVDPVNVCDSDGTLLYNFAVEVDGELTKKASLTLSDKNEVIVAAWCSNTVYIYTEEGELKRSIKLPEDHWVLGVAFHHVTKTVIVHTIYLKKTYYDRERSFHLLSYSETGDLQTLPLLHDGWFDDKLTSHQSGPVAFVHQKGVIFI